MVVEYTFAARIHGAGPTRIEDERSDAVGQGSRFRAEQLEAAVGALVDGTGVGGWSRPSCIQYRRRVSMGAAGSMAMQGDPVGRISS